jgi:proton-dependent oligopeptide transporter, POT family
MINSKYFPFTLLLLAETIERFSYYFVSFVILFYMMTNLENGGLGFSQENAMKMGGYFSFGILFFPLIIAPFIDRNIGYMKATFYGGSCLVIGYLLAFMSSYFFPWLIVVSLSLCVIGSALLKPTMSVLVGKFCGFSRNSHDIAYILFVLIVNVASLSSAYVSAKLINQYGSFKPFFIISMVLMVGFSAIMFYVGKKNQHLYLPKESNSKNKESKNILPIVLILCLLVGASTTVSTKIFSFPASVLFWIASFFGMLGLFFIWNKTSHKMKRRHYLYMMSFFFLLFLFVNLFMKSIGSFSSFIPSIFSSFDMLLNFFIFPLALSFISRFAPQNAQATFQALAFFLFSLSSIMVKNYLPVLALSSNGNLWLLTTLILLTLGVSVKLFFKLDKN